MEILSVIFLIIMGIAALAILYMLITLLIEETAIGLVFLGILAFIGYVVVNVKLGNIT